FLVELGDVQEQFDGLVRLFVEQVVEAAEVRRRQLADLAVAVALAAPAADDPAREGRDRQQQEEPEPLGDEGHVSSRPPRGGGRARRGGAGAWAGGPRPSGPARRRSHRGTGCPAGPVPAWAGTRPRRGRARPPGD